MKYNLPCFLFLILVNLFYYALNTIASPIINGIPDENHVFKFHVSIYKKKGPQNEYQYSCGGSIISERYILTIAHCFISILDGIVQQIFYPANMAKIIAGSNHRYGPGIERDLIRVFIPLEHNGGSKLRADIAVAELRADLGVHQNLNRLAIMPLGVLDPRSNAGVNQQATFCGSGLDTLVQQRDRELLPATYGGTINRYLNVKILGRDECSIFENFICVRNRETSAFRTGCKGDSGSGLVYGNKIVGVLSLGPRNCNTLEPIIFTRLNGYMRFIEKAQNPRGDHRNMYVLDENPKSPNYPFKGLGKPKPPLPNDELSCSFAEGKKTGCWPFGSKKHHGGSA